MVRLTDRPDMTLDVYRGRKTTMQQQQQQQPLAGEDGFQRWRHAIDEATGKTDHKCLRLPVLLRCVP